MRCDIRQIRVIGLLIMMFFLGGCETTPLPSPFDLTVNLGEELEGASMQVDLIGIPEEALPLYRTKSVSAYFEPGDTLRETATKHSLSFGRDSTPTQLFPATDPIWSQWIEGAGADYLIILADLPGLKEDRIGNADARRLILPLHKADWEAMPEWVTVEISGETITPVPAPLETY